MSRFSEELHRAMHESPNGLVTGEPDAPTFRRWSEVFATAQRWAAGLARHGVGHGDSVAILVAQPADVAPLIQAVWLRGAVFTMLHQPTPRTDLETWVGDTIEVLDMLDARFVVVGTPFEPVESLLTDRGLTVLDTAVLADDSAAEPIPTQVEQVPVAEDDLAILQLTSGSTGTPKAVAVSHRNLYRNHLAMVAASAGTSADVTVSWLPLFHDMGMVGFLIEPMICGGTAVCMTPMDFLTAPLLWPELITKYRGTMTAAPNFAYSVLARRLRSAPDGAYDLSSLRFVLNGAEPIDMATIDLLLEAGGRFGLRPEAMVAAYGMAEATLAVSFSPLDQPLAAEHVDVERLEVDRLAVPVDGPGTRAFVPLGSPLPGLEARVVDRTRSVVPHRQIGEIEIRGEAVTRRYLTPAGYQPAVDTDDWFPTGDLGYLTDAGEVVISGRKKDLIIIAGRNLSPADIEKAAGRVAGVRNGGTAAVPLQNDGGREDFAVIVESDQVDDEADCLRIRSEVSQSVLDRMGATPGSVLVVAKGTLPKTPSGKIRRTAARELVESR